ncbi:Gamma-tubulin complex component 4 [Thoreauomyces humboldtii]|nr:Gamma-tubulin complex component 4 [Thoreauomyces humboldtii]
MLHELLLTLCGHSGDIFVPWPQALPTTYAVAPDFPLLHPAERTALNRLARIGFNYASIRTFIDAQKENVWDAVLKDPRVGPGSIRPGFYLLALCGGLEEVLEGYMDVVVEAERKVLSSLDLDTDGARTPLSYFTYVFGKILLPQLLALLKTLEAAHTSYHGAKILDLLHSSCKSGLSESCMAVFYRQLVGWMLYGSLTDPHDEFFVQRGDLVKHGTGDNQLQLDRTRWQSQYVVEQRLVPDFIPESMAATILFIGKAVVTIKESKRPERARIAALITKHVTPLSKLSETSGFRPLEFQTAVNNVKEDVAAILWDVVVMDEHLVSHLKAFKECYLMGSGDLWMGFIEECGKLRMKANSRLSLVTDHGTDKP